MSLNYARLVPRGRVYAFEPTDFALRKLRRNLELNPTLARRIEVTQTFVSHETSTSTDLTAYASWPVDGTHDAHAHPLHQGRAQATPNVGAITLDDFVTAHGIERLDFIKIDTDGHELDVLRGARAALARFRPSIVFEVGLYTMRERGQQFEDFLSLFESERYRLLDAASGAPIDRASFMLRIPERSTIDVLALPL
jgi:FkbM family methyltransferase